MRRIVCLCVLVLAACGVPPRPARPSEAWLAPALIAPPAWEARRPWSAEAMVLDCDLLDPWHRPPTLLPWQPQCPDILDPWTGLRRDAR